MRINNNLMAMNAHRYMSQASAKQSKSLEKLSSGLAINSAADNAAGLAISEKMRSQINGLEQASANAQDGISMIQTAEGALQETHNILQRMRELSVQASNDTMESADRTAIGEEMKALGTEIDRIANNTEFNGRTLLDGSLTTTVDATSGFDVGTVTKTAATLDFDITELDVSGAEAGTTFAFTASGADLTLTATIDGSTVAQTITITDETAASDQTLNFDSLGIKFTLETGGAETGANLAADIATTTNIITATGSSSADFAIGANAGQNITVSFGDMNTDKLGDTSDLATLVKNVDSDSIVDTTAKAQTLITEIDAAIVDVSTQRGEFGAAQNRLEHTINNLSTTSENLTASESRIRDVDMAKEMMEYTKLGILQQASQAMLAQANQAPQGVLQLLR